MCHGSLQTTGGGGIGGDVAAPGTGTGETPGLSGTPGNGGNGGSGGPTSTHSSVEGGGGKGGNGGNSGQVGTGAASTGTIATEQLYVTPSASFTMQISTTHTKGHGTDAPTSQPSEGGAGGSFTFHGTRVGGPAGLAGTCIGLSSPGGEEPASCPKTGDDGKAGVVGANGKPGTPNQFVTASYLAKPPAGATLPGPVQGVTAAVGTGGQVDVSWQPLTNGGPSVLDYWVQAHVATTQLLTFDTGLSAMSAATTGRLTFPIYAGLLPGTLTFTVTAENWKGRGTPSTTSNPIRGTAPKITSQGKWSVPVNQAFNIVVANSTGTPTPALVATVPTWTVGGNHAPGPTFTDNGQGQATLSDASGPPTGSEGQYPFTVAAVNAFGIATASFTFSSDPIPAGPPTVSLSTSTVTVPVGSAMPTVTVSTTSDPPNISESGALPSGIKYTETGLNTATVTGTPPIGSEGTYTLTFTGKDQEGTGSAVLHLHVEKDPTAVRVTVSTPWTATSKIVAEATVTPDPDGGTVAFSLATASGKHLRAPPDMRRQEGQRHRLRVVSDQDWAGLSLSESDLQRINQLRR